MLDITSAVDDARYSDVLETLINDLGGKEILGVSYESDYQGFVDIDVQLGDGRVFSYYYPYGSCSGCDEWEDRDLSDEQVLEVMKAEATIFDTREQYETWRKKTPRERW